MIATVGVVSAQSNTEWKVSGNTVDSSAFIGTTNASCLRFRSNDIERMRLSVDGKLGIGITDPQKEVDVNGDIRLTGDIIFKGYEDLNDTIARFIAIDKDGKTSNKSVGALRDAMYTLDCYETSDNPIYKSTVVGLTLPSWANRIANSKQILYTGVSCPTYVGIGTNLPETILDVYGDGRFTKNLTIGNDFSTQKSAFYIKGRMQANNTFVYDNLLLIKDYNDRRILQLDNDGLLRAREVKVDTDSWPDYVFEKNYTLQPLSEVERYINQHKHLPNVPSAEEAKTEGLNLGEMNKILLQKVEELTLHLIEQQKMLEKQQQMLIDQQQEVNRIKVQVPQNR